jgi:hypothetical protein
VLKHFHFSPYKLFATFENFPFRWKILKCNLVCRTLTQIHINVYKVTLMQNNLDYLECIYVTSKEEFISLNILIKSFGIFFFLLCLFKFHKENVLMLLTLNNV